MSNINLNRIKLIIWDLDDTFWKGTLSEGKIVPDELNINLVKLLTKRGIINSICSKNNEEDVFIKLKELGVESYFVFNSINWLPKGNRIKDLISSMQLRDENVLFIDDNISNLKEAKFYNPNLMISSPEIIKELNENVSLLGKDDVELSRLKQYKVLEEKVNNKKNMSSNEEFLRDCNIKVNIEKNCIDYVERIHELILRSNQLNFTKNRCSKDELISDINNSDDCGIISVNDKYGNYGICGFYMLKDNFLKHFVFSCRAMGMGIEQYIYLLLGKPQLIINGPVSSDLNEFSEVNWINKKDDIEKPIQQFSTNKKCLFKGPCDMQQLFSFIKNDNNIECEFTFINDKGVSNESWNHTVHILESVKLDENNKCEIINDLPFADNKFYYTRMFTGNYKYVFLSMLTDPNLGVYRNKNNGAFFAFGEWCNDLTNQNEWENFINGNYYDANFKFNKDILEKLKENYEYVGRLSSDDIVNNVKKIRYYLPRETTLVLLLGSEIRYDNNTNKAYECRELFHKELNDKLKEFLNESGVKLINFTDYVKNESNYTDNINHYRKNVYYEVSKDIVNLINLDGSNDIKVKNKLYLYKSSVFNIIERNKLFKKLRIKLGKIKRKIFK